MAKKFRIQSGMSISAGQWNNYSNGVMFSTNRNYVIALDKQSGIEITEGKRGIFFHNVFNHIPFITGIVFILHWIFSNRPNAISRAMGKNGGTKEKVFSLLGTSAFYIILCLVSILIGWICNILFFNISPGSFSYALLYSTCLSFIMFMIVLASIKIILTEPVTKYHGAEHKVANTLRKKLPLTDENINKQSIYHVNCGTNMLVNNIIIYPFIVSGICVLLNNLFLSFVLSPIISIIVSLELLRISQMLDMIYLGKLFNIFGIIAQRLTVKEPDYRHMLTAKTAMLRLMEIEENAV